MTALTQVIVVNSVAEMRQLDVSQFAEGQLITLLRYWPDYDGGEGTFAYSSAAGGTDGGIVFTPLAGAGHFFRLGAPAPVLKGRGEGIEAEWFGAIGDRSSHPLSERFASLADAQVNYPQAASLGQETDRIAIQAALDFALQHNVFEVRLTNGEFILDDTLHLGYGVNNGYSSVALTGAGISVGLGGTVLLAPFADRPAIAVQGARSSAVRDLAIEGANLGYALNRFTPPVSADTLNDCAAYFDPALLATAPLAESQHAPYAGIAIDPYCGEPPADAYPPVAYPSWLPEKDRVQYGKTPSSGVQIENVRVAGFVVGIVGMPSDYDKQGDFTKIHKCDLEFLKWGISIGNGQARNTSIRDCTYNCSYTFLTNSKHGSKQGQLNGPIDNVGGGASCQFADITLGTSAPVRFSNIYFEDQVKFGIVGTNAAYNSPVTFESCMFELSTPETGYSPESFIDTSAYATLRFTGCHFTGYGKFLNLTNESCGLTLDSCTFEPPTGEEGITYTGAEIIAQNYTCGGIFCLPRPDLHGVHNPKIQGAINSMILTPAPGGAFQQTPHLYTTTVIGQRVTVHQGAEAVSHYPDETTFPILARKPTGSLDKAKSVTGLALQAGTLTFTALHQDNYELAIAYGDLLSDSVTKTLFLVTSVSPTAGNQAAVTAEIVTNYQVTNGQPTTNEPGAFSTDTITVGTFFLVSCSIFNTTLEYRGTTVAGKPTINAVLPPAAYASRLGNDFQQGDMLFYTDDLWGQSPVFPPATRIISVDTGNSCIMVDHDALLSTSGYLVTVGFLPR
ncbi:MAG: hypothetical protein J2P25_07935 [Nocardiopsaceae bacterium]|nr:hypothetical protein [Nocardiopsaceae bacterium]